jgi:hypothetical protein
MDRILKLREERTSESDCLRDAPTENTRMDCAEKNTERNMVLITRSVISLANLALSDAAAEDST